MSYAAFKTFTHELPLLLFLPPPSRIAVPHHAQIALRHSPSAAPSLGGCAAGEEASQRAHGVAWHDAGEEDFASHQRCLLRNDPVGTSAATFAGRVDDDGTAAEMETVRGLLLSKRGSST